MHTHASKNKHTHTWHKHTQTHTNTHKYAHNTNTSTHTYTHSNMWPAQTYSQFVPNFSFGTHRVAKRDICENECVCSTPHGMHVRRRVWVCYMGKYCGCVSVSSREYEFSVCVCACVCVVMLVLEMNDADHGWDIDTHAYGWAQKIVDAPHIHSRAVCR